MFLWVVAVQVWISDFVMFEYVVSVNAIVSLEDWFNVISPLEVQFCVNVIVELLTDGIVGLLDKSLYEPDVATVIVNY